MLSCDPWDCSPPGSSIHGILQARILSWVAIPFSRGSSWPRDHTCISCISCIGRQILYHWATWEATHTGIIITIRNFTFYHQHVFQGQVSLVLRLTHKQQGMSCTKLLIWTWVYIHQHSMQSLTAEFWPEFPTSSLAIVSSLPVTFPHISCIFMPSFLYLNSFLWAYKTIQSSKSLLLSFLQAPPSQMNDFFSIFLPVAARQYSLYYLVHTSGRVALIIVYLLIYLWLPIPKTLGTHTKKVLTFCRNCVFSNFISPVHWGCIELCI